MSTFDHYGLKDLVSSTFSADLKSSTFARDNETPYPLNSNKSQVAIPSLSPSHSSHLDVPKEIRMRIAWMDYYILIIND